MAIEIEDYQAPVRENEYTQDVADLAAAGEGKLGKIVVKAGGKVASAKLAFQTAARNAGYSARVKLEEVDSKGATTLGFVLSGRRTRRASDSVDSTASDQAAED